MLGRGVLVLVLLLTVTFAQDGVLIADKHLYQQHILSGQSVTYTLSGLAPNSHYEVRISNPAYTPADFFVEIVEPLEHLSTKSRDLLNAEKVMFTTDSNGYITGRVPPGKEGYHVKVTAKGTGVPPKDRPDLVNAPIQYNIVLETLFYGAPYDILKIGIFIAVLCVFVATILVPQIFPNLNGFKHVVNK